VLHRDERFSDEPETFDPGRWERDVDRPEYAYFPFSGGPRHCVGMRFARLELALALATMVDRVALDVSVDGPLTFTPSLSLRPENDVEATVNRV
jgi:cytochrome P450